MILCHEGNDLLHPESVKFIKNIIQQQDWSIIHQLLHKFEFRKFERYKIGLLLSL